MVIEYYSPKELNLVAFPKTGQYIIRTPDDHAVNQGIVVKRVQTNHGVVNNKHGKVNFNAGDNPMWIYTEIAKIQPNDPNFKNVGKDPKNFEFVTPFDMTIIDKFDRGELGFISFDFKFWFEYDIEAVKNKSVYYQDFLNTYSNLVSRDIIIDKTTTTTTPTTNGTVITPTVPVVTPPTITISAEVQAILTKFDNNDYTSPSWFNSNIEYVKNGSLTSDQFLNAFNNLLQTEVIIDKTIPVEKEYDVTVLRINEFGGIYSELFYGIKGNKLLELESQFLVVLSDKPRPSDQEIRDYYNFVDTSINENMITQSIGAFTLKDGKVTGDIIYIAESAFNSYYYNKPVTSIVQIKNQAGNTIKLKTNNLNFTETQRDETITINEGVGDLNAVKIEFYVWKGINEPISFALKKVDEIVAQEIGLKPCPIGQHRNFNGKCVPDDPVVKSSLLGKVMGVTALLGTLALLGSKSR